MLLQYVLDACEPGQRYSEKQVNNLSSRYRQDIAAWRRGLIEYHLMAREDNGGAYWRIA